MNRLTSYDPVKELLLINEEERLLSSKGFIDKDEMYKITRHLAEKLAEYEEIGTVEECREARESQIAKKYEIIHPCKGVSYYQCPCCDGLLHINENFCGECGQAIDWSE